MLSPFKEEEKENVYGNILPNKINVTAFHSKLYSQNPFYKIMDFIK